MISTKTNGNKNTVIKKDTKDIRILHRYTTSRIKHFDKILQIVLEKLKTLELNSNANRQSIEGCVRIVANCQQNMAKLIGRDIERFALEPAIEAVVMLADEIIRLNNIAAETSEKTNLTSLLDNIRQQALISVNIANGKLDHLGIEKINPINNEIVNSIKHNVCSSTSTDNRNLHGKVSNVISEGIIYRNKILKQAKVSIYCYSDTNQPLTNIIKEQKNGSK